MDTQRGAIGIKVLIGLVVIATMAWLFYPIEQVELNARQKNQDGSFFRDRIIACSASGKTDSVIYYILESDQLDLSHDPSLGISLNLLIGDFFVNREAYSQALKYRLRQLHYHRLTPDKERLTVDEMFCYGSLGTIYRRLDRPSEALKYLNLSKEFAERHHDSFLLIHAFNNYGLHYFFEGDLVSAEQFFKKALDLKKPTGNKPFRIMEGIVHGNLGRIYMKTGRYNEAIEYLNYNIESATENDDVEDLARTLTMLGEAYSFTGNRLKAEECLKRAELLINTAGLQSLQTILLSAFLTVYGNSGDIELFRKYDALFKKARDTESENNSLALNDALTRLTEQRVSKLEVEKKGQQELVRLRTQRFISIGVAGLIFLSWLFLYYRRKNRDMARTAEMEKTKKKLLQAELRKKELEQQKLDAELRSSQQDLTHLALNLRLQEQIKKTLLEKLQLAKDSEYEKQLQQTLNEMLGDLNKHLHDGQGRVLQAEHISTVNDAFYSKLQQRFPKLTKGEVELCGLIRMKISSKEIATLKNISPDSVKITRHRLRKKLGLNPEEDIYRFIENI